MIATPRAPWPSWKRFVLRFAFVYVGLLSFSFPLSQLPGVKPIAEWLGDRLYVVLDWMVLHIFGVVPAEHTRWEWNGAGHGDDVAENLAYLSCAILTLLGATAWSIVDRMRAASVHRVH